MPTCNQNATPLIFSRTSTQFNFAPPSYIHHIEQQSTLLAQSISWSCGIYQIIHLDNLSPKYHFRGVAKRNSDTLPFLPSNITIH